MLDRTTPPELARVIDWQKYKLYLDQSFAAKTAYDRMRYAKQYHHVLQTHDVQDLLTLTSGKQKHAMKALATLSKFIGCYDTWKQIKERHRLRWSNGDSLDVFNDIVNGDDNYPVMMQWLKSALDVLPESYRHILLYNTMTGLRPSEAIISIGLVKSEGSKYVRGGTIEHFRYPDLFIRRTKKAYISLANKDILDSARAAGNHSYASIRSALEERGMATNLKYCRKIFSTHLRMAGIESELIDLLQGRVPKTVFGRHYFRPDFDAERPRMEKAIQSLAKRVGA